MREKNYASGYQKIFLIIPFIFLLIFSCKKTTCPVNPQGGKVEWEKTFGGGSNDVGYSLQLTSDGGYIILGVTRSNGTSDDFYLIKTNQYGEVSWERTYGGILQDVGRSVQETEDDGYILVGYTQSADRYNHDVYLIKTDIHGDTLWTRTYGGGNADYAHSVQQINDGGYIVVGETASFGTGGDVYLIRIDVNGDTLWTKTYGGDHIEVGYSVQVTSNGGYIIAGKTASFGAGCADVYLIKTDGDGNTLWTKTYGGGYDDYAYSIKETSDGGYIITGWASSFGVGGHDVYLIRTDENGNLIWEKTYGNSMEDAGISVQETSDGGYIIVGHTQSVDLYDFDVYLIKTDTHGNAIWTSTYGGTDDDGGLSVQETSDGGYIITGATESSGAGKSDVYLIKIEP